MTVLTEHLRKCAQVVLQGDHYGTGTTHVPPVISCSEPMLTYPSSDKGKKKYIYPIYLSSIHPKKIIKARKLKRVGLLNEQTFIKMREVVWR